MSGADDEAVKPIKRMSSQKTLEKLELFNRPEQHNKPMDSFSDVNKNKRSVYASKLKQLRN